MFKKLLILSTTIIMIFSIIFVNKSMFINKNIENTDNNIIKEYKKELSMMLETSYGSGKYEKGASTKWPLPSDGYIFNNTLSKCENGGELMWDDTKNVVLMTGNISDKCYVYFDAIQKAVINEIITSDITLSSMTITINATKGTFDISKYYYSIDNGATWNESTSNIISISGLTKGTTYAIKAYVQDARKINSDYKIVNASTLDITLITFTIDGTQYYAEENMTWKEWIASDYSNGNYEISRCADENIALKNTGKYISSISQVGTPDIISSDLIIENQEYRLMTPQACKYL